MHFTTLITAVLAVAVSVDAKGSFKTWPQAEFTGNPGGKALGPQYVHLSHLFHLFDRES